MKKFLIITVLAIVVTNLKAQFVTIPDSNFAKYLQATIPAAMTGNQMDTTNTAVDSLPYIYVENLGIKDITGVQYFKGLVTLDCGNGSPSGDSNKISFLPPLPLNLDTLICGNNTIDSLPVLPSTLKVLKCYINRIKKLPILPGGLTYLDCSRDSLDSLPALPGNLLTLNCNMNRIDSLPVLPSGLTYLDCGYNLLKHLPILPLNLLTLECEGNNLKVITTFPSSLLTINCSTDSLTVLPVLPPNLSYLSCDGNFIDTLPVLPGTLTSLSCGNNLLIKLPSLPSGLSYLECGMNTSLDSLPALPPSLVSLWCQQDNLKNLPVLPNTLIYLAFDNNLVSNIPIWPPNLMGLYCSNNNISCFPVFPSSLKDTAYFSIDGNPFNCLPDYVPAMRINILAYPLCYIGNSHGCPPAGGIVGFTYHDVDSNCVKDSLDNMLTNIPMELYNGTALVGQTNSLADGVYDFPDSAGTYKVLLDTAGMPFTYQCSHPGIDSVVGLASIDTNINFSIGCKGADFGVRSVVVTGLVFPGMQHKLNVVAGDMAQWFNMSCAKGDSGTVQIYINGPFSYAGPAPGALTPIVTGNVFTYHTHDYDSINSLSAFGLLLNVDSTAKAGESICVSAVVTPLADIEPSNNTYSYCYSIVNSHDPNLKTVCPAIFPAGYKDWFTYTIQFQNTGSAPAHTILIRDTLNSLILDLSTFQIINYSNANSAHLIGNVLTVSFPDINLPDSTSSPKGSIGFIQYRIKPRFALPTEITIQNTGYIYFDYNPPVVTNTAQSSFGVPTAVNDITPVPQANIYPNPSRGEFTVSLPITQSKSEIVIYNEIGEMIYDSKLSTGNNQVNLAGKAQGIYFYRITTEDGKLVSTGKLVLVE